MLRAFTVLLRHTSLSECTSDPECGWCSADDSCQGRTVGVNCTTNLQTTRCPGVCPSLSSCHACLARPPVATAHPATASVAAKLRLSQCTWCVQNARCHHKHGKSILFDVRSLFGLLHNIRGFNLASNFFAQRGKKSLFTMHFVGRNLAPKRCWC